MLQCTDVFSSASLQLDVELQITFLLYDPSESRILGLTSNAQTDRPHESPLKPYTKIQTIFLLYDPF